VIKNHLVLLCIIITAACNQPGEEHSNATTLPGTSIKKDTPAPGTAPKTKNSFIINPGKSIGELELGTDASLLAQQLGQPDLSDAAMGKAWTTWYGKKRDEHNNLPELNVFTTYRDTSMKEKTVQLIRTSSSDFSANGVKVYDALTRIKTAFPRLQRRGEFVNNASHQNMSIYDAKEDGIAFEVVSVGDHETCAAIIVHPRNKNVMDHYLGFLLAKDWVATNQRQ
jgi:hypothetical protein